MKLSTMGILAGFTMTAACGSGASHQQRVASHAVCDRLGNTSDVLAAVYDPGNVYKVEKAEEVLQIGRASVPTKMVGAKLYVAGQPGLNEAYAERALNCHAASGRAAHPNDPLVPSQGAVAEVTVESVGSALAVRIVGADRAAADDIWRRAQALSTGRSIQVEQIASSSGASGRL